MKSKHGLVLLIAVPVVVLGGWLLMSQTHEATAKTAHGALPDLAAPAKPQKEIQAQSLIAVEPAAVAAATTSSAPSAQASRLDTVLNDIVQDMSSPISRWSPEKIRSVATRLSAQEIQALKTNALNGDLPGDLRRASVYLLSQAGPGAAAALGTIAGQSVPAFGAEVPHTPAETKAHLERNLRITSLEALDRLALRDRGIRARLESVLKTQDDPSLVFLTQVSLAGIQEGRPGKLTRFMDRALAGQEN